MLFITVVSSNCSKYVSWFIVHCFFLNSVTFYVKKWNYRITVICLFLLAVNKLNSKFTRNFDKITVTRKLRIIYASITSYLYKDRGVHPMKGMKQKSSSFLL